MLRYSFAFVGVAVAATPAGAQVMRGTILDAQSDRRVPAADIAFLDDRGQRAGNTTSDSAGAFQLRLPRPGAYQLRVTRIGYVSFDSEIVGVREGEAIDLLIRLSTGAVPLNPLVVTARRRLPDGLAEFERRRRTYGTGHFITRVDIERRPIASAAELVIGAPHVTVVGDSILLPGTMGRYCHANVYVDGQLIRRGVNEVLLADWIGGIEVYRSAALAPSEYHLNNCGSVLFWTLQSRTGGDWNSGSWTAAKIALGALLAVATVLLVR